MDQTDEVDGMTTDKQRLEWLAENADWDGYVYWMPEPVVRDRQDEDGERVPEPTLKEIRRAIDDRLTHTQVKA